MNEALSKITDAVVRGSMKETLELTKEALDSGVDPARIIDDGLMVGMDVVGDKFEKGEFFLPDMMLAAKAMSKAIELIDPFIKDVRESQAKLGTVVMGTVQGDLHEIGKNIVILMMKSAGFKVIDLGVDVPSEEFVKAVQEQSADVLGISALMTTTIQKQHDIIDLLKENGLRNDVKVLVGGAPLTEEWAKRIGADGYAPDAIAAVRVAKDLLSASDTI